MEAWLSLKTVEPHAASGCQIVRKDDSIGCRDEAIVIVPVRRNGKETSLTSGGMTIAITSAGGHMFEPGKFSVPARLLNLGYKARLA